MTDLSISNVLLNSSGQIDRTLLGDLKHEGELSALIVDQLRHAPTLRQAAREMLVEVLRNKMRFPNPDAVFVHATLPDGKSPPSLSLTDALLCALMGDRSYIDSEHAAFSARKDSAHRAHWVVGWDMNAVRGLVADLLPRLPDFYKFAINEFWEGEPQKFDQIPGEEPVIGTREQILGRLYDRALSHAIKYAAGSRQLDTQDETRLYRAIDSAGFTGCYEVSLLAQEGVSLPLIGAFVTTRNAVDIATISAHDEDACVYLHTHAHRIEKFATLAAMESALHARLIDEDSRESLLDYLLLEHRVAVEQLDPALLHLDYQMLTQRPAQHFITRMREKQLSDFDYLLAQSRQTSGDLHALLEIFDEVSQLDDLKNALNIRYLEILTRIQVLSRPDWLKFAEHSDRQRYDQLAAEQSRYAEVMQQRLEGVETREIYARKEIDTYLTLHLGYTLDPARVIINLPDEMAFDDGPLKTVYSRSLLHFAMEGMPQTDLDLGPGIEIDPGFAHLRLTFDFVSRLVKDLDLKHRYGVEVRNRYRDQATLTAMSDLRANNILLSAWAAKLQGHLSARGLELIDRVQSSLGGDGTLKVGGLFLKAGNQRFEDVVIMRELSGEDELYVLHAPGVPGGRDMFEFHNWRQLSFEVGGWTATAAGTQYLLDQTAGGSDDYLVSSLESFQLKPSHWFPDSVAFVAVNGSSFKDVLTGFAHYKIERTLSRNGFVSGERMRSVTGQQREAAVQLDYRIAALNTAFAAFDITSWRDAARAECQRLIEQHLKASGVPGQIDPDTVYCDLSGESKVHEPDFGRYTTLKCLTDLFMAGYAQQEYEFHERAVLYSSIGQDLSKLSAAFIDRMIRGSDFGHEYITQLRHHTFGLTNSPPQKVRALFSRKINYEMRRDVLIEYIKGRLTLNQYNWLSRMIANLDGSTGEQSRHVPGKFYLLSMERRRIANVYILKPDTQHADCGTLAYTPNAPDGHLFRPEQDIVHSVARPGMRRYYYDRATYKSQRIIGTLLLKLEVSALIDGKPYTVGYSDSIRDLQWVLSDTVQHLIVDIDSQTESVNERRLLNSYTFIRKYGGYVAKLNPVTAAVWHGIHAGVDLFRGIYAYQDGDRVRAKAYFVAAAWGVFKTSKQVRKIRKKEKLKRLGASKGNARAFAAS